MVQLTMDSMKFCRW